ncbi:hypothetical protein I350_01907 [Cryptococcus amylolentus CBS 6273]|nr:hypothetical protein I350_01907 [Cryptococcus amylolentus CBS 6273]
MDWEKMLVFQLLYALPTRHHAWCNQLWATSASLSFDHLQIAISDMELAHRDTALPTAGALISQSDLAIDD